MAAKFELYLGKDDQFYFRLKAANGENILGSEGYPAKANALSGIASVRIDSALDTHYLREIGSDNRHYFVLRAANYEPIGKSQMYSTTQARDIGIQSVKTNGPTAPIEDLS